MHHKCFLPLRILSKSCLISPIRSRCSAHLILDLNMLTIAKAYNRELLNPRNNRVETLEIKSQIQLLQIKRESKAAIPYFGCLNEVLLA
jgi:hypothetical protein